MGATNKIFQANVYIRALNFQGLVEEFDAPGLTSTRVEHSTVSGLGTLNLHSGFDLLEARFKWKAKSKQISQIVSDVFRQYDVQVRYILVEYAGTTQATKKAVIVFMKGRWRNTPNGNLSPKSDLESESMFDVDYIREEIDGETTLEFDPANYIYKVNGVDMLADERAILGIS